RFAWQTTAVLWNKAYFDKIKGFDDKLSNLQDIEISIKALFQGKNYRIITNNEVDFQYFVTPINTEKRTIFKITQSVIYLLKKLVADYNLSNRQLKYLRGYYFLCVRYYVRGKLIKEGEPVMQNCLKVFRQIKILGQVEFLWASFLLKM